MMTRFFLSAFLAAFVFLSAQAQGVLLSLNHDNAGLGLASTSLSTSTYTMVGDNGTTTDGYASGVADLDCFGERFFYVLANPYRLVTLDAVTGDLISSVNIDNPLDADVPASNLAYDWTDNTLYGLAHWYSGGTNVQLIAINPSTGAVETVSDGPDFGATFGSGNCDMDALGNRYFMFGGGKLKAWNTTTGAMVTNATLPTMFGAPNLESWTHPMYHPVEDRIYALHMLQPEDYDFYGPLFQTELRLARIHPETAEVEWMSEDAISMDGIQSGVCDLDPFNNRIFYQRVDELLVLNTEGQILSSIAYPANTISPWTNVQYHDLSTPPTAVVGEDSDGSTIQWDGTSALTLSHNLGSAVTLDGWSDDEGATATTSQWNVNAYGTVQVHGHRVGESGETVEVQRTFHIVPEEVDGVTTPQRTPCHSSESLVTVFNLCGQVEGTFSGDVDPRKMAEEWGLTPGLYLTQKEGCPTQKWVIQ